MLIQIKTAHAGNLAMTTDRFELPLEVAKEVAAVLSKPGNSWWYLKREVRLAKREHRSIVKVYTAGFGSQELVETLWRFGHTTMHSSYRGFIED